MKLSLLFRFFILINLIPTALLTEQSTTVQLRETLEENVDAEWLVVGAGPAGILTIGLLHDLGIPYNELAWVDPEFNVGRMGEYYQNVPANNQTGPFIDFINECRSFNECVSESLEELRKSNRDDFPCLCVVVKPLQDITNYFLTKLKSEKGFLENLYFENNTWHAQVQGKKITANHVVLATGAEPRCLNNENCSVIPLDQALDPNKLEQYIKDSKVIGVFGGAHSAILLLKFLYDLKTQHIINFYRSPIVYTVDPTQVSLNSIMALKGATAQWARQVLEGENPPSSIVRIRSTDENIDLFLPLCDKVIYAIGYKPSNLPLTEEYQNIGYNPTNGIIAPRLFGIGLAFPEQLCTLDGQTASRVGLTSFMDYAQRVIPQWVAGLGERSIEDRSILFKQYRKALEKFEKLFVIDML
jgi:hypothetical protein